MDYHDKCALTAKYGLKDFLERVGIEMAESRLEQIIAASEMPNRPEASFRGAEKAARSTGAGGVIEREICNMERALRSAGLSHSALREIDYIRLQEARIMQGQMGVAAMMREIPSAYRMALEQHARINQDQTNAAAIAFVR